MIIVLGFLCSGSAYANKKENAKALGYGANRVDFNFECKDGENEKNFGFHKIFSKKAKVDVFIALPVVNSKYSLPIGMVDNLGPTKIDGKKYEAMMVFYSARYLPKVKSGFISKYIVLSTKNIFILQEVLTSTEKKNVDELNNILNLFDRIAFNEPQKGLDLLFDHHVKASEFSSQNFKKNHVSTFTYLCNVTK